MYNLYSILRPLFFLLPPEAAHYAALNALSGLARMHCLPASSKNKTSTIRLLGLNFPNQVGLAAGLDKNGDYISALEKLGFGFIEVGTVTPNPQLGNPKPRLFRLTKHQALINRMGFNNKGLDHLLAQLEKTSYKGILGINIGKNKTTPNEQAASDYLKCFEAVYPYASYVTVNLSSPNTPDLRELQYGHYLSELLGALKTKQAECQRRQGKRVPLLVKIAPDLDEQAIHDLCHSIQYFGMDGVIATNTTISRPNVSGEPHANEAGGLSGAPLKPLANTVLQTVRKYLPKPFPVIAVGGVTCADDVREKMALGADLVQLYTGLIYQGPALVRKCIDVAADPC